MSNKIAALGARVGIVALASLAVFGVSGAASAAPSQQSTAVHRVFTAALTPAECVAIQKKIQFNYQRIDMLEELLQTAPPYIKGDIIKTINNLYDQIDALRAKYNAGCRAVSYDPGGNGDMLM